jgi:hypothetical protein
VKDASSETHKQMLHYNNIQPIDPHFTSYLLISYCSKPKYSTSNGTFTTRVHQARIGQPDKAGGGLQAQLNASRQKATTPPQQLQHASLGVSLIPTSSHFNQQQRGY